MGEKVYYERANFLLPIGAYKRFTILGKKKLRKIVFKLNPLPMLIFVIHILYVVYVYNLL
jgi:hypothetical protein